MAYVCLPRFIFSVSIFVFPPLVLFFASSVFDCSEIFFLGFIVFLIFRISSSLCFPIVGPVQSFSLMAYLLVLFFSSNLVIIQLSSSFAVILSYLFNFLFFSTALLHFVSQRIAFFHFPLSRRKLRYNEGVCMENFKRVKAMNSVTSI